MASATVVIILATGEPRFEWCDVCLLPSVVEVDLFDLRDDGPHPLGVYRQCQDHE